MSKQSDPAPGPTRRPERSRASGFFAPLLIFSALAVLFVFALRTGDPSKLPSALIGKPAPLSTLPGIAELTDGARVVPGIPADAFKTGAPAVVNFWASWCAPCVEEHPYLVRLKKEQPSIRLLGINYKDEAGNARRFLGRYGNPFDAIGTDENGRTAIEWGVYGMPETFVVDRRGIIIFKHVGPLSADSYTNRLLPAVQKALAG